MPVIIVVIFAIAGLLMLGAIVALAVLIAISRRKLREQRAFATARGWKLEDRRRRHNEVHWSGTAPGGVPWRLISEYGDADGPGHSRTMLIIGKAPPEPSYVSIPEPQDLRWAALDPNALSSVQALLQTPLDWAPGEGFTAGAIKGLLKLSRQAMSGRQLRTLLVEGHPHRLRSPGWVLLAKGKPPLAVGEGLERLDRRFGADPTKRPWVLGSSDTVMIAFPATLEAGEDIEEALACAIILRAAASST